MIYWLEMFTEEVGNRMPMSEDLHLPSRLTKIDIYNLANMLGDSRSTPCIISLSSFYDLRENKLSDDEILKVCLHLVFSVVATECTYV